MAAVLFLACAAAALDAGGSVQDAHAQQQELVLTPVGQLRDKGSWNLDSATSVDVFTLDGKTYAVVAGYHDDGIHIADVTNPSSPSTAGYYEDASISQLDNPRGVEAYKTPGGTPYAVVVGDDDAVQLMQLIDPSNPKRAGNVQDESELLLENTHSAAAFVIGAKTYVAVTSRGDDGIQIVDVAFFPCPCAAGKLGDDDSVFLDGASGVDTFAIGNRTYAAVASINEDALQIVDVTDPDSPTAAGRIQDLRPPNPDDRELSGAVDVAVFERDGKTYAAVSGHHDNGISIIDVSNPNTLFHVGRLADNGELRLREPNGIDAFRIGAYSYVAVASQEDALQIVDVTDPSRPAGAGKLTDSNSVLLANTSDVKVFKLGHSTYAVVTSWQEDGIQLVRIDHWDDSPPGLASAALDVYTGVMTLTFDETIDVSETRLSEIYVSRPGTVVVLTGADLDRGAGDSATVSLTLTESQVRQIAQINAPQIRIDGGAVSDLAGNARSDTTFDPIIVTNSDKTKPVITLNGDRSVTVELGGTYAEQGATVSDNDPAYAVTEATVDGDTVDTSAAGIYTVTYTAPADNAGNVPDAVERTVTVSDTTPPMLVSATFDATSGIMTIEFNEAIDPVHAVVDFTLDGALLGLTFDVDATSPNVITKQLGDDLADRVGQWTVSVGDLLSDIHGNFMPATYVQFDVVGLPPPDTTPPRFVSATIDLDTMELALTFDEAIDISETNLSGIRVSSGTSAPIDTGAVVFDRDAPDSDTLTVTLDRFFDFIDFDTDTSITLSADSVKDTSGNGIAYTPGAALTDVTPLRIVSGTYETTSGVLTIVFSETIDISAVDGTGMLFGLARHSLYDHSDFDGGPDSDTITVTMSDTFRAGFDPTVNEASLLVHPFAVADQDGNFMEAVIFQISVHTEEPTLEPPERICAPPSSGHWDIRDSCALESDARAPAGITVHAPAVLYIPAGVTLDVDLANHGLLVKQGAGLLIQHGGGMR